MGYNIYLQWDGMTKKDQEAQYTGFSIVHGHVGYLRESYGGRCHATHILQDLAGGDYELTIDNYKLADKKNEIIEAIEVRYKDSEIKDEVVKSWVAFIALHKEKEEAGLNPVIHIC